MLKLLENRTLQLNYSLNNKVGFLFLISNFEYLMNESIETSAIHSFKIQNSFIEKHSLIQNLQFTHSKLTMHKYRTSFILLVVLMCISVAGKAQNAGISLGKTKKTTTLQDSLPLGVLDTLSPVPDDSLSSEIKSTKTAANIKYSSDSLDVPVNYSASDSMVYDIAGERIHLYGGASVEYESMSLKADYIIFDMANDVVIASSLGGEKAEFVDGEQSFNSDSIKYNFRTHKGKVYQVRTTEGGGFLLSNSVKFDMRSQKHSEEDDVVYAEGTIYTTCDHPEPHFGIRSRKAKIIPNKVIVVGASNLEIENIPTPLILPFGFFPLKQGRRSGLIFPRNYEFSPTLGFGLRNIGYYKAMNDYWDLQVTGDIYTRGTWGLNTRSNYKKRYKYSGSIAIGYSNRRLDIPEVSPRPERDFNIQWSHNQDASAHPTRTFRASVNFGTGTYFSNNFNDAQSVLNSTLRSGVSVRKKFPGKPYTLSAGFSHSQNTSSRLMTINFPEVTFNLTQINPFERKNKIGKERWYEKITFSYNTNFEGIARTNDTLIFERDRLDEANLGVRHDPRVGMNFRILKYINVNPSINYSEEWYFKTTELNFDTTTIVNQIIEFDLDNEGNIQIDPLTGDTLIVRTVNDVIFGQIDTTFRFGFDALREVSGGVSFNTRLYGMLPLGKQGQAIRHTVTPNVSMNFSPDYLRPFWGYYDSIQVDNRDINNKRIYSRFENGVFGGAPSRTRQASISYGITNQLEGKFFNKRDSTERFKKIMLINQLSINSSYNFAADSFNMANIRMSGNTKFFGVINANFGAGFDPYALNSAGTRINTFYWQTNRRLMRFTNANLTLTTRLNPQDIRNVFGKNKGGEQGQGQEQRSSSGQFISSLSFTYSLNIAKQFENGKDSLRITRNNIGLSRTTLNLTGKWRVDIGSIGYDFVRKQLTYPDLSLYRDLHCWESGFQWQPERRTFSFFLRVKPGTLDFLRIPYARNRFDPFEF